MTGTLKKMSKHTNKVRAMVIQCVFILLRTKVKLWMWYCFFYCEQVLGEVQEAKEKLTKLEEKVKKQVSAVVTPHVKILKKSIAQINNNRVL